MPDHMNNDPALFSVNFIDHAIVANSKLQQPCETPGKGLGRHRFEILGQPVKFGIDAPRYISVKALEISNCSLKKLKVVLHSLESAKNLPCFVNSFP